MQRVLDVAALDGILVDVFQLLQHYLWAANLAGTAALLPDLVGAPRLVRQLAGAQLAEKHVRPVPLQQVEDLTSLEYPRRAP